MTSKSERCPYSDWVLDEPSCVVNFVGQVMPMHLVPDDLKGGIIGNSKFQLGPNEEWDECPYNRCHLVRNVRMIIHLMRCRRNYIYEKEKKGEQVNYECCPNRVCGIFPSPELEYHAERCNPHVTDELRILYGNKAFRKRMKDMAEVEKKNNAAFKANGTFDEDWEKEANGYEPGYDPRYKLIRDNILVMPRGVTRMERREFKEKFIIPAAKERERLREEAAKSSVSGRDPFEILYGGVDRKV